tara:strand:+ start:120 stop:473 length:354 start_codon:yes stop_codon:yes gene_type:complete
MNTDKLVDRLIPTSLRDWIVLGVIIVAGILLWDKLGSWIALALGGLFFQGSNEEQKKAKTVEKHYKKMAATHLSKVKEHKQTSYEVEVEIKELDKKIFVDSGESNAEIVNRIHHTGL